MRAAVRRFSKARSSCLVGILSSSGDRSKWLQYCVSVSHAVGAELVETPACNGDAKNRASRSSSRRRRFFGRLYGVFVAGKYDKRAELTVASARFTRHGDGDRTAVKAPGNQRPPVEVQCTHHREGLPGLENLERSTSTWDRLAQLKMARFPRPGTYGWDGE